MKRVSRRTQSSINIEFHVVNDDTLKIDENKISILFTKNTCIFHMWIVFFKLEGNI